MAGSKFGTLAPRGTSVAAAAVVLSLSGLQGSRAEPGTEPSATTMTGAEFPGPAPDRSRFSFELQTGTGAKIRAGVHQGERGDGGASLGAALNECFMDLGLKWPGEAQPQVHYVTRVVRLNNGTDLGGLEYSAAIVGTFNSPEDAGGMESAFCVKLGDFATDSLVIVRDSNHRPLVAEVRGFWEARGVKFWDLYNLAYPGGWRMPGTCIILADGARPESWSNTPKPPLDSPE